MSVCFPAFRKRSLGVGLDLPWDGVTGFGPSPRGDGLAAAPRAFLERHSSWCSHAFFSWQPRDRAAPTVASYAQAWNELASVLPSDLPRALHHTALNLASLRPVDRTRLLDFTAELCERYQLRWVNEDVGFWSLDGRAVPYPLPPLLTDDGLRATIANTRECQRALPVPLLLEFPGFSEGASVVLGELHAYDFFRTLAEETEAPVALDVGHLLSWQWWRGKRGDELFSELDRLPLAHCFELHLSGCELVRDRFIDAHHGRLLDEQLTLTSMLMERCPNLRAITYEDPRFDVDGRLLPSNQQSLEALRALVTTWEGVAEPPALETPLHDVRPPRALPQVEAALAAYVYGRSSALTLEGLPHQHDAEAVKAVRKMVLERRYRGTGGLEQWYPKTIAAWHALAPDDMDLSELSTRFCASLEAERWREHGPGSSLEEALYWFFEAAGVGDTDVREDEFLGAILRAFAVTPDATFTWPGVMKRTSRGAFAVSRTLTLHAVVEGRYLRGTVTPLIAALLDGEPVAELSSRLELPLDEVALVHDQLVRQGLDMQPFSCR